MKNKINIFFLGISFFLGKLAISQDLSDTSKQKIVQGAIAKEYEIAEAKVFGNVYTDGNTIRLLAGLYAGDKVTIPGEKFAEAIKNLWKNNLFDEIEITADSVTADKIWIGIRIKERPRLWNVKFIGVSKSDKEDLQEKIRFVQGKFITEYMKGFAKNHITDLLMSQHLKN